jgi:hypothetical protein
VPLLELPQAQFVLMSATLGDVTELAADLTRRNGRETAIEDYYAEHDSLGTSWDARGPDLLLIERSVLERTGRSWPVRQTLADPAGHHDWVIAAEVDVDASDELGEQVLMTIAMRRL